MGWMETLIERVLSRASARAREESPRARELLGQLAGKRLAISVAGTPFDESALLIESDGQGLRLVAADTSKGPAAAKAVPDATVRGAPLSLLALTRTEASELIQRGDLHVGGDGLIVQRFAELGELLAPDLEQSLSQLIGRSAAHVVVNGLRAAANTARTAAWTSVRNVAEYLAHESGDLVSRQEATHFMHGVEQAREQLDRLEARMALAERRTDDLAGGSEPS
jgi:ubiquinone biosynthesis protein UbiJ